MPIAKPPISPDVAEVIGACAEKVENRSLLLGKFVIHKSWPAVPGHDRKSDDGPRWSFMRVAENGEEILRREAAAQERRAKGANASPENRSEAEENVRSITQLLSCKCRKLSTPVEEMRKAHVDHLIDLVKASSLGHRILFGRLESRLAVNLSDSLIQNAGICLDRLFGVPYLPGSAVKGVCRHVALEDLRAGRLSLRDFQDIFGTADVDFAAKGELASFMDGGDKSDAVLGDKKGCIDFLSAYPRSEARLMVDLTNVHFPKYYQTGREEELGNEEPRPNPFPVVEAGAEFAFCIALNSMGGKIEDPARRDDLLDKAAGILRRAMVESGFGAKTGAGYGWFADETEAIGKRRDDEVRVRAEKQRKMAEDEERRRQNLAVFGEVKAQLDALEAREGLETSDRVVLAQLERKLKETEGEGATPLRDRINILRKKLPAESFSDKLAAMHPNEVVSSVLASFDKLSDDDKMSVVEFLRTESGREIWKAAHTDKKLSKKCGGGQAVHAFVNAKKLPKIPQ